MTTIHPAELARFDQLHRLVTETLTAFTDAHREALAQDQCHPVSLTGLVQYLQHHVTHLACAELLAVAIDQLTALEDTRV